MMELTMRLGHFGDRLGIHFNGLAEHGSIVTI